MLHLRQSDAANMYVLNARYFFITLLNSLQFHDADQFLIYFAGIYFMRLCILWILYCIITLFLGAFAKLRKAVIDFVMFGSPSIRLSACNNSASTRRILIKFDIRDFFENLSRKFKFC
jgi:hypothetical protein